MAALLRSLPGRGGDVVAALDAVLFLARAACPSCVAVSLTVDQENQPVTVTATSSPGRRHAPSMTVRLPRPASDGPAAQLVVFATDAAALARLAIDIGALLEIHARRITLSADAAVPPPVSAGRVLAGQLADRAEIDRAVGALLAQGWIPAEGRRELQRRADAAGASLVQTAAVVLAALPNTPPQQPS